MSLVEYYVLETLFLFSGYFVQFKYITARLWNIFQTYCPDTWTANYFVFLNEECVILQETNIQFSFVEVVHVEVGAVTAQIDQINENYNGMF